MVGGALWIDFPPPFLPPLLQGISLEAEGRDLSLHRAPNQPSNLREDIASGGVLYTWKRYYRVRPYGKFLMGYGNTDYMGKGVGDTLVRIHQSRTVTTMGGGVELEAVRHVWARVDYGYQFWPDFFKATHPAGELNPQGFTFGVSYHFNQSKPR